MLIYQMDGAEIAEFCKAIDNIKMFLEDIEKIGSLSTTESEDEDGYLRYEDENYGGLRHHISTLSIIRDKM